MSLVRIVALMVREMGEATVEDVAERMEGKYSEQQVRKAMANARVCNWVRAKERRPATYQRAGVTVYEAGDEKPVEIEGPGRLQAEILEIVLKSEGVTVTELMDHFPGKERYQVTRAIGKLAQSGKLDRVRRIFTDDNELDNCWYVPPGQTVRITSVWDIAGGGRIGQILPTFDGGRTYMLLSDQDEDECAEVA